MASLGKDDQRELHPFIPNYINAIFREAESSLLHQNNTAVVLLCGMILDNVTRYFACSGVHLGARIDEMFRNSLMHGQPARDIANELRVWRTLRIDDVSGKRSSFDDAQLALSFTWVFLLQVKERSWLKASDELTLGDSDPLFNRVYDSPR